MSTPYGDGIITMYDLITDPFVFSILAQGGFLLMKTKKRVLLLLAATLLVYTSFLPVSAQTTAESDPVPYIEGEGENTDP